MAGVNLSGMDPWPAITAGTDIGAPSAVLGMAGGDWLNLGLKVLGSGLFGGGTDQNVSGAGASGGSVTGLNSSGWSVGSGSANGGDLSAELSAGGLANPSSWPWWGWAGFTLAAVLIIKKGAK